MCHVHVSKFKAIEGKQLTQISLKIKTYNVKTKNPNQSFKNNKTHINKISIWGNSSRSFEQGQLKYEIPDFCSSSAE